MIISQELGVGGWTDGRTDVSKDCYKDCSEQLKVLTFLKRKLEETINQLKANKRYSINKSSEQKTLNAVLNISTSV